MRLMGIGNDDYYLMRYELAYDYFKRKGYVEDNIRLMVLSSTFWRWWNQQLSSFDFKYLHTCDVMEASQDRYKSLFIQQDVYPSWSIMRQIRREGLAAMKRNREFSNLKL